MYGGNDVGINNRIGRVLLDIMPAMAVSITAKAEVLDDWAKVRFEFKDDAGTVGKFSFKDHPGRAAGDIGEALVELRGLMARGGDKPWSRVEFTAHRDSRFNVEFAYDEDPDE